MGIVDAVYSARKLAGKASKLLFLNKYTAGKNFTLYLGGGIIGSKDKIIIGNNVSLHGWLISDGGKIIVGDNTTIHQGAVIRAMDCVKIGTHADIGSEAYIQDHNSMSLDPKERRETTRKSGKVNIAYSSVTLGNDVWIGRRAMIMKGVSLPDASIVAAGAVVTKGSDRPALFAGNPARIVRYLTNRDCLQKMKK
ncbi:MAG: acyltransferase [Candidatus Micrarchaeia archaeon]